MGEAAASGAAATCSSRTVTRHMVERIHRDVTWVCLNKSKIKIKPQGWSPFPPLYILSGEWPESYYPAWAQKTVSETVLQAQGIHRYLVWFLVPLVYRQSCSKIQFGAMPVGKCPTSTGRSEVSWIQVLYFELEFPRSRDRPVSPVPRYIGRKNTAITTCQCQWDKYTFYRSEVWDINNAERCQCL